MYLKFDGTSVAVSGLANGVQQWATGSGQTLSGGNLNDVLGGQSNDVLIGGGGDNQYYLMSTGNVIVQGPTGVNTVTTWMDYTLPDNIQNLNVSGADGLHANGNSLDNLIVVGDNQNMQLYGGGGNDVLVGGAGNDLFIINAGEGNDAIYNWHAGDQIRLGGPTSLHSFADVRAAMRQQGSDVVVQNGDTAFVIRKATVSQFTAADFQLTPHAPAATLDIAGPGALHEGDSGVTDFAFTVTRSGDLSATVQVDYFQAYGGTADSSDFAGPTAGTVTFAAGQASAVIHIAVAGDTTVEPDETFIIALANARGATIATGSATATIVNDDTASAAGGSPQTMHSSVGETFWSNNNGNTLHGGAGDDTFHLGRGGDVATGGGGNDVFAFAENPWSPSGRITDFNAGDVIDLTETLHRAGYVSGDPIAEGFVKFGNDTSGAAQVWFNPDPTHSTAFWLVTGLDGVDAGSLHANAGLITV